MVTLKLFSFPSREISFTPSLIAACDKPCVSVNTITENSLSFEIFSTRINFFLFLG